MEAACGAIRNVTASTSENEKKVDVAGGCELLVRVLEQQMGNAAIVKFVCGAIWNVTASSAQRF